MAGTVVRGRAGKRSVKIFGAKRTGTNYLHHLIRNNYQVDLVTDRWWKHGVPPLDAHEAMRRDRRLSCLITVKNPYAWIVSRFRFVRLPIATLDQRSWTVRCLVHAWVDELNATYRAWHNLSLLFPRQTRFVRYEDLLENAEATLGAVAGDLRWRRLATVFWSTDLEAVPSAAGQEHLGEAPFDRSFYTERRFLSLLGPPLRRIVDEDVDWPLFGFLGYRALVAGPVRSEVSGDRTGD